MENIMEGYEVIGFLACWHCLEFLILNDKISKFCKYVLISSENNCFKNCKYFSFLQDFLILDLSPGETVVVTVTKLYERNSITLDKD